MRTATLALACAFLMLVPTAHAWQLRRQVVDEAIERLPEIKIQRLPSPPSLNLDPCRLPNPVGVVDLGLDGALDTGAVGFNSDLDRTADASSAMSSDAAGEEQFVPQTFQQFSFVFFSGDTSADGGGDGGVCHLQAEPAAQGPADSHDDNCWRGDFGSVNANGISVTSHFVAHWWSRDGNCHFIDRGYVTMDGGGQIFFNGEARDSRVKLDVRAEGWGIDSIDFGVGIKVSNKGGEVGFSGGMSIVHKTDSRVIFENSFTSTKNIQYSYIGQRIWKGGWGGIDAIYQGMTIDYSGHDGDAVSSGLFTAWAEIPH